MSQVKYNGAKACTATCASERRQDSNFCMASDFTRHCGQAGSEGLVCCSCKTGFELIESLFMGYCPCLRFLLLPFVCCWGCYSFFEAKYWLFKAGQKAEEEYPGWYDPEAGS